MEKKDYRVLKITEISASAGIFALTVGLGILIIALLSPFEKLGTSWTFIILSIPLFMSPFIYTIGFIVQETLLSTRSRIAQLFSAFTCAIFYLLGFVIISFIFGLIKMLYPTTEFLFGIIIITYWLLGPVIMAIILVPLERRILQFSCLKSR